MMDVYYDLPTGQLQFVTEPADQMSVEGDTVHFHCSVQSGLLVTFVWEFTRKGSRDSQVIADSTGLLVLDKYSLFNFGQTTSRLSVYSAELSDAGSYTCSVSTSTGQNIHADAQLEVLCKYTKIYTLVNYYSTQLFKIINSSSKRCYSRNLREHNFV